MERKEAIEVIKKNWPDSSFTMLREALETLVPELKESEDERIRKEIIDYLSTADDKNLIPYESWIAYLEKQHNTDLEFFENGENEKREFVGYGFLKCKGDFLSFKEGETYWLEYVGKDSYNVRSDNLLGQTFHITPQQLYTVFRPTTWLEKQGEQKPADKVEPKFRVGDEIKIANEEPLTITKINEKGYWSEDLFICGFDDAAKWELVGQLIEQKPTDKVESKFKVGDWIVYDGWTTQIKEVYEDGYSNIHQGFIPKKREEEMRLWTIQDAKDGDVLTCPLPKGYEGEDQIFMFKCINSRDYVDDCIEYYCRVCEGVFYENKNGYMGTTSEPLYPATKEQRDLLFQKMKEAGYEWSEEFKEIRKTPTPADVGFAELGEIRKKRD